MTLLYQAAGTPGYYVATKANRYERRDTDMAFTPYGGVEVFDTEFIDSAQGRWHEYLDLSRLVKDAWYINHSTHYDMFGLLFGHPSSSRVFPDGEAEPAKPVAMDRGLPADVSLSIREFYEQCCAENETWVIWQKLKGVDLSEICRQTGKQITQEWGLLFDIMRSLARWYGEDKVRLIVYWCD